MCWEGSSVSSGDNNIDCTSSGDRIQITYKYSSTMVIIVIVDILNRDCFYGISESGGSGDSSSVVVMMLNAMLLMVVIIVILSSSA